MACSKLFARCALFSNHPQKSEILRNLHQPFHHYNNGSNIGKFPQIPGKLFRKFKDSILLLEATKGTLAKVAIGLCQSGATAALVFGTGYALALLTTGHDHSSEASSVEQQLRSRLSGTSLGHVAGPIADDIESVTRHMETRDILTDRRINLTYFHMITSLLVAGITSILSFRVFQNKAVLLQLGNRPMVVVGLGVVTPFLMGSLVRNLPRTQNKDGKIIPFGIKEFGHLLYAGSLGLIAAPLYLMGGLSMARSLYVTAGCMMGLHGVATVIPKDCMLKMETPLMLAINAVLISFLLTLVLRQNHYAFMPLYRFMMHGGILVYSAGYLHSLQTMGKSTRSRNYDPVNAAMSLSMNLLNIFARLAFILPPYYQLCRDHQVILPSAFREKPKLPSSPLPSKSHKPDGNNSNGGGAGGGSGQGGGGNEM